MIALVGDHLWQSTLFAMAAALVCFALRRNHAQVRYRLWQAASIKFLVPFAALLALGGRFEWGPSVPVPAPAVVSTLETLSQPFSADAPVRLSASLPANAPMVSGSLLIGVWALGALAMLALWWVRWRRIADMRARATPIVGGRELECVRRLERAMGMKRPLAILSTTSSMEPAVFGIFTPALLWPSTIGGRLSDLQSAAVIAHEVAHVRRRDNFWAAIHHLVQSIFWFHPVVWWLSARLVDERERACDEDVMRQGSQPEVYAQSILRICELCVASSPVCAAGVSGSDLRRRIEHIMANDATPGLTGWRRTVLTVSALAAVALPLAIGALVHAPILRAQAQPVTGATPRFDAVSIKRNTSGQAMIGSRVLPDGSFTASNLTLRQLVLNAYQLQGAQLVGAPSWIDEERFDIEARPAQKATVDQARQMMRALLVDRFKLRSHAETRELPVYALVFARSDRRLGPGLKETPPEDCAKEPGTDTGRGLLPCGVVQTGAGMLNARAVTMEAFAAGLMSNVNFNGIDRIVVDRTGLTGKYGWQLRFQPVGRGGAPPVNDGGQPGERPVFFTALQEELGLKLDPQRAPIEVLVVDSVDRPTEN